MAMFLFPSKDGPARPGAVAGIVVALTLVCAPLFGVSAHAASQYVIISAEPASGDFPAGKVLEVGDAIDVPEHATVTLLGEEGSVVAIPGPAKVAVTEDALETSGEAEDTAEKNRSTLSKLASLLSGGETASQSLGVSRGFNAKKQVKGLDDPWVLSIHDSALGCVQNEPLRLGRSSSKEAISIDVEGADAATTATLDWPAGESTIELPDKFSPSSDEIFVKANGKRVLIDLRLMPKDVNPDDPMAVLGWMVSEGCNGQALAFTRLLVHQAQ